MRSIYDISDAELAGEFVDQVGVDLQDQSCPPEVLPRPHHRAVAGPDRCLAPGAGVQRPHRGVNNLIKRIKRIGFGFRRFAHYRIGVLPYAGKPDWNLLATVTPR